MRHILPFFIVLFLTSCGGQKSNTETNDIPTFEDFRTGTFCNLTSASTRVDDSGWDLTLDERNSIREQYLSADKYYNCEYSIATVQDDNGKWKHFIIFAPNGKLTAELTSAKGIVYSKESSLIVVDPVDQHGAADTETTFWTLEHDQLKKIK